jgi:gliding motility-associated-like protein
LNNPIITGAFSSPSISFGTTTLVNYGWANLFLAKFDPNGNPLWAIASITTNQSQGYCVTTDRSNNIYFSGTYNTDIIIGNDTLTQAERPMLIAKYDANGKEIWVKPINSVGTVGSGGNTVIWSMVTDFCKDVYLSGGCGDTLIVDKFKYVAPANSSDPAFVSELDSNGNLLNAFITNTGGDDWNGIALNSKNDLYFGGDIEINTFIGDSLYYNNVENAFLSKFTFGTPSCCKNVSSVINTKRSGDSTVLTVSPPGQSYLWSNGATASSITVIPVGTTSYSVEVSDSNGCPNTASIVVQETCGSIFIPTAFSPNKDGQNDMLYVRGNCIKTMDFVIYDRWGNRVFESNNLSYGWDGTYKGMAENTAVFAYYLHATLQDGTSVDKKGNISLIR